MLIDIMSWAVVTRSSHRNYFFGFGPRFPNPSLESTEDRSTQAQPSHQISKCTHFGLAGMRERDGKLLEEVSTHSTAGIAGLAAADSGTALGATLVGHLQVVQGISK